MKMELSDAARQAKRQYAKEQRANMTPEAKAAQREYKNKWQRENREKCREYQRTYWERVAARKAAEQTDTGSH